MSNLEYMVSTMIESSQDLQGCFESILQLSRSGDIELDKVLPLIEHLSSGRTKGLIKRIKYRLGPHARPNDSVSSVYDELTEGNITCQEADVRLSNAVYAGFQRSEDVMSFLGSRSEENSKRLLRSFTSTLQVLRNW